MRVIAVLGAVAALSGCGGRTCNDERSCGAIVDAGGDALTSDAGSADADATPFADVVSDPAARIVDAEAGAQPDADAIVPPVKRVFVTKTVYMGAVLADTADKHCSDAAAFAHLGGDWRAWITVTGQSPRDRATHSALPYALLDGTTVADNWTGLISGSLRHAIDRNEDNLPATRDSACGVWTGTDEKGAPGADCQYWTNFGVGKAGDLGATDSKWTNACDGDCNASRALYCVEQ